MTRKGSFVNFIPTERGLILWRIEDGWLEYRFETETEWKQVFEINQHTTWTELSLAWGRLRHRHADGQGGHGSWIFPSLNYEFRVEGDYLQFRYGTGADWWINILDLSQFGGGHTIKDETTTFPDRANLKFTGDVTVTDDEQNDETVVNVSGGGGAASPKALKIAMIGL